ncbi:MAG: sigma-70 family RNA polymerase sigma factor [Planctomycetota bacterium]
MDGPSFDVAELQAMEDAAWARFQEVFFRRVYFFVKRYVDDHQTAEDLTQDVFLGAVRGIANYDPAFTLEQFLFGIAKNRVIDHFRKHRVTLLPAKADADADKSHAWLENMAAPQAPRPADDLVESESAARRRRVLGQILRSLVEELWQAGEFKKLQVLEYIFVLGGRNKDAARLFGIADEKAVAGIKFRAIEKLRALARQSDPNHSLFLGLWSPGSR